MNKVELVGRLTKDPEVRYSNDTAVARFTVAVDRKKKDETDFISCVAFGKTAEFIEKYFNKGQRIGLCGRIQTGVYQNKDGQNVYTTDVIIEEVEFVESARESSDSAAKPVDEGFLNAGDGINEELPFN